MGVVHKAQDLHLDRLGALTVLPPEKLADPERKQRFTQEAKAASALNHPHIITIYDIASEGGVDFIAMEHVAGETLDQVIPRKGKRLNEALEIAVQGCGRARRHFSWQRKGKKKANGFRCPAASTHALTMTSARW